LLGPVGYVREPAAPARLLNAATVVPDEHRQHPGVRVHHDVDAVGPRVPRRVGQRLAQHGEHLLGELAAGARVEPAAEPHRGREPEHLRHLVGERWSGGRPWMRPTVSTPRTLPGVPSGNRGAGPMCPIGSLVTSAVRGSSAKFSTVTGVPLART
jgi:hypothetical protein